MRPGAARAEHRHSDRHGGDRSCGGCTHEGETAGHSLCPCSLRRDARSQRRRRFDLLHGGTRERHCLLLLREPFGQLGGRGDAGLEWRTKLGRERAVGEGGKLGGLPSAGLVCVRTSQRHRTVNGNDDCLRKRASRVDFLAESLTGIRDTVPPAPIPGVPPGIDGRRRCPTARQVKTTPKGHS